MKKLLYFVSEDWYFCSHRLPLAVAASRQGYEVVVLTRIHQDCRTIQKEGLRVINSTLDRRSLSLLRELRELWRLVVLYRQEKPDIVHHVALKPVLYGTIATMFTNTKIVNALAGLGFVFSSNKMRARLLRPLIIAAFKCLLDRANSFLIVQNTDDHDFLIDEIGISSCRIKLIAGSGVDVSHYTPLPEPKKPVTVTLVARMLWDKGIGEFVKAAILLKQQRCLARFLLVGSCDSGNPASIDEDLLRHWHQKGDVEWRGHASDIRSIWAESHVAVLPSYREGLPKSLLEAMACGRPIITTDAPGCRGLVDEGINGYSVPVRNVSQLADSIKKLIDNPELRRKMGQKAREKVVTEFSADKVHNEFLSLYKELLQ